MARNKVTIQDVAKAAGVSTATVSRTLSNPKLVHEDTRESVEEAVRKTGYRLNRAAQSLRRNKAAAVLVLVPNLGNTFFSQILSGLSQRITKSEYAVLMLDTQQMPNGYEGVVDYFLDSRIDGMISLDGGLPVEVLETLNNAGVSDCIVTACEWIDGANLPSVRSDNFKGAKLAVQHLYDLGHRRIAHVTGPEDNVLTHVRRGAMLEARCALNLPMKEEWIIRGDFSLQSGRDAAKQISSLPIEDRPTAVFCASDEIACGLISELMVRGVRVPDDISVIGFDDIDIAEHFIPPLTTIRQDRVALGQKAADRMIALLDGDKTETGQIELVDVELVERDSTRRI